MLTSQEIGNEITREISELMDEEMGAELVATGNTYPVREKLKHLGFEWWRHDQEWLTRVYRVNDTGSLWAKPSVITTDELDELIAAGVEFSVRS